MGDVGGAIEDFTGVNLGNHSAADRSLAAQRDATNAANATQLQIFNQTREDLNPYRDAGATALSSLANGDILQNFQGDPGYQFRLSEGMKALQNSAAAKGNLNSGATLKALTRYGQNFASNEYNNAYNREYGRLSGLANLGQNSAVQTGAAGQKYANAFSNNMTDMASATGAAALAQAGQRNELINDGIKAYIASDRRLKKNIRPVSKEDIEELQASIKPYHFEYISKNIGDGEFVGLMAQDLEKSKLGKTCVVEDEFGNKKVNLTKLLSLLVVSFAKEAA